jgi:hypothetical protein
MQLGWQASGFGGGGEEIPPVVDQRDHLCGQLAARQILRRVSTPTPSVFQFVDDVFAVGAVGAVAIELRTSKPVGVYPTGFSSDVTRTAYSYISRLEPIFLSR